MRKELFEENYQLLQRFCGELLTYDEPDFWLDHKEKNNQFGNSMAERLDENLIVVGTCYVVNGDTMRDPTISILFDSDLGIARVSGWIIENYGMALMNTTINEFFSVVIDEDEASDSEIEANDYLNTWLKAFVPLREKDPNYFKCIQF